MAQVEGKTHTRHVVILTAHLVGPVTNVSQLAEVVLVSGAVHQAVVQDHHVLHAAAIPTLLRLGLLMINSLMKEGLAVVEAQDLGKVPARVLVNVLANLIFSVVLALAMVILHGQVMTGRVVLLLLHLHPLVAVSVVMVLLPEQPATTDHVVTAHLLKQVVKDHVVTMLLKQQATIDHVVMVHLKQRVMKDHVVLVRHLEMAAEHREQPQPVAVSAAMLGEQQQERLEMRVGHVALEHLRQLAVNLDKDALHQKPLEALVHQHVQAVRELAPPDVQVAANHLESLGLLVVVALDTVSKRLLEN